VVVSASSDFFSRDYWRILSQASYDDYDDVSVDEASNDTVATVFNTL
jgi:hypothetical protein